MQLYTKGMIQYGFRGMEEEIVNPNDYGMGRFQKVMMMLM
jgi:hypothetical protein